MEGSKRGGVEPRIEAYRGTEPRTEVGEHGIMNIDSEVLEANRVICSRIVGSLDTIPLVKGSLPDDVQEVGLELGEHSGSAIEDQDEKTGSATKAVNTYSMRYAKSSNEWGLGNDNALVVWMGGAEKGNTDNVAEQVEEEEGHYYDPIYADEIAKVSALDVRPPPSNWVLQRILDFSKIVGVSCDGYEDRL